MLWEISQFESLENDTIQPTKTPKPGSGNVFILGTTWVQISLKGIIYVYISLQVLAFNLVS